MAQEGRSVQMYRPKKYTFRYSESAYFAHTKRDYWLVEELVEIILLKGFSLKLICLTLFKKIHFDSIYILKTIALERL